jgi:hypothetical protein
VTGLNLSYIINVDAAAALTNDRWLGYLDADVRIAEREEIADQGGALIPKRRSKAEEGGQRHRSHQRSNNGQRDGVLSAGF